MSAVGSSRKVHRRDLPVSPEVLFTLTKALDMGVSDKTLTQALRQTYVGRAHEEGEETYRQLWHTAAAHCELIRHLWHQDICNVVIDMDGAEQAREKIEYLEQRIEELEQQLDTRTSWQSFSDYCAEGATRFSLWLRWSSWRKKYSEAS